MATAQVTLNVTRSTFVGFNSLAPTRCTLNFSVTSPGHSDPTPANNLMTVELNVFDSQDPVQTAVHETFIKSLKPLSIAIGDGTAQKSKGARPAPGNADLSVDEDPGDLIVVTAMDGDCPPGTLGAIDYDSEMPGAQNSVTLPSGKVAYGALPVTATAAAFTTSARKSPSRCTATVSVAGPGGDTDASNNTTQLVIDVYDRNDF
jgi:hypothetical protein